MDFGFDSFESGFSDFDVDMVMFEEAFAIEELVFDQRVVMQTKLKA